MIPAFRDGHSDSRPTAFLSIGASYLRAMAGRNRPITSIRGQIMQPPGYLELMTILKRIVGCTRAPPCGFVAPTAGQAREPATLSKGPVSNVAQLPGRERLCGVIHPTKAPLQFLLDRVAGSPCAGFGSAKRCACATTLVWSRRHPLEQVVCSFHRLYAQEKQSPPQSDIPDPRRVEATM